MNPAISFLPGNVVFAFHTLLKFPERCVYWKEGRLNERSESLMEYVCYLLSIATLPKSLRHLRDREVVECILPAQPL